MRRLWFPRHGRRTAQKGSYNVAQTAGQDTTVRSTYSGVQAYCARYICQPIKCLCSLVLPLAYDNLVTLILTERSRYENNDAFMQTRAFAVMDPATQYWQNKLGEVATNVIASTGADALCVPSITSRFFIGHSLSRLEEVTRLWFLVYVGIWIRWQLHTHALVLSKMVGELDTAGQLEIALFSTRQQPERGVRMVASQLR